ncbi:MAG: hypothetical protein CMQ16_08625 [Gammaproteobacteria bacterium]|nr:hypothetical protein [Gammaproteobacteria bacterium]
MDISLSLCCLFISKDTLSASTRKGNAVSSTFNLAARKAIVQSCNRPASRLPFTFLAHLLPFRMTHRRSQTAGRVDAAATADTAKQKVATEHDFAL